MAEEVLDVVHVGAGAEEFGGAGAAEGVGGDVYAQTKGQALVRACSIVHRNRRP